MTPQFKTAFQDPDTMLFEVGDKHLTEDELKKLQQLMPSAAWFTVRWVEPYPITNPSYIPYEQ